MNIYITQTDKVKREDIRKEFLSEIAVKNLETMEKVNEKKWVNLAVSHLLISYLKEKRNIFSCLNENENGKPYLEGANFDFSFSSGGNIVVLAENDDSVGVDVMPLRPILNDDWKNVLNPLETQNMLAMEDDGEKWRYFYRCLTEKSSYMKFLGKKMPDSPSSIKNYEGAKFVTKYLFLQSEIYCLTVCAKDIRRLHAENINYADLINK